MENVECSRAFIHGSDWTSWVDYCKGRGATDDMFVAAFSKVARRTMGAEEETDDAYKCMKAMNVINEFNVAVSNLTTVVQVARFLGDCPLVGFLLPLSDEHELVQHQSACQGRTFDSGNPGPDTADGDGEPRLWC